MRRIGLASALLASSLGFAHNERTTIFFEADIAPILQRHCLNACHAARGIARQRFDDYLATRPWVQAIGKVVMERRMPPTLHAEGYGSFENDGGLTGQERALIISWVEQNGPKGDGKEAHSPAPQGESGETVLLTPTAWRKTGDQEYLFKFSAQNSADTLAAVDFPSSLGIHCVKLYRVDSTEDRLETLSAKIEDRRLELLSTWIPGRGLARFYGRQSSHLQVVAKVHFADGTLPLESGMRLRLFAAKNGGLPQYSSLPFPEVNPVRRPNQAVRLHLPRDASLHALVIEGASSVDSVQITRHRAEGGEEILLWKDSSYGDWEPIYQLNRPKSLHKGDIIELLAHPATENRPNSTRSLRARLLIAPPGTGSAPIDALIGRAADSESSVSFVCPMHPEERAAKAGRCPKCGMELAQQDSPSKKVGLGLETKIVPGRETDQVDLTFSVFDLESMSPVKSFIPFHEKPFHLFIVSQDLGEYQHVHPEIDETGLARISVSVPHGRNYLAFANFMTGGITHLKAASFSTLMGKNDLLATRATLAVDLGSCQENRETKICLKRASRLVAGLPTTLEFAVFDRASGHPAVDLEDYLGALAHIFVLDTSQAYPLHTHPDQTPAGATEIPVPIVFPKDGTYRLWVQIQRRGQVETFPFTLPVYPLTRSLQ